MSALRIMILDKLAISNQKQYSKHKKVTEKQMKSLKIIFGMLFIAIIALCFLLPVLNGFQRDGELSLPSLTSPVTVVRDEKGMAYIKAENFRDAIVAQGFVVAQDRLLQMELTRLLAQGRLTELAGEKVIPLDTRMRTLGLYRNALKQEKFLSNESRDFIQAYQEGINEYIKSYKKEHPKEFKIAGIEPTPWRIADTLAVLYYMAWGNSANIATEITTQMLIEKVGVNKAVELWPLNINPDDEDKGIQATSKTSSSFQPTGLDFTGNKTLVSYIRHTAPVNLTVGSNNWIQGASKTETGKVMFTNDPHLDTHLLPGPWHPVGIITPDYRAVGVNIPGVPGIVIGRNQYVAFGLTNSFGDAQDLYIETIDPGNSDNYLEGDQSIPFTKITETLKIKDKKSATKYREKEITIKYTRRGPVISDVMSGLKTKHVITMRFAPFESPIKDIAINRSMKAKSAPDFRKALSDLSYIMLNYVFGDTQGNIGWQTTGKLPIRSQGESITPFIVKDGTDNWIGWIPFDKMPHSENPSRDWIGTCNHMIASKDDPQYFSSYFATSYRYRRLKELMASKQKFNIDDSWQFMRDTKNLMAQDTVPKLVETLLSSEDTKKLGEILKTWDFFDEKDKTAPLIYQALYHKLAELTVIDELGKDLTINYLDNRYLWKERFRKMVLEGNSPWFDDITTPQTETIQDMILKAAENFMSEYGKDPSAKKWGDVHYLEFVCPIIRNDPLKDIFGGGSHAMGGSGETLYRGAFNYSNPFKIIHNASLRMVVDLADDDKVTAVIPGGVVGRQFHENYKDQIEPYMTGEKRFWWFSDAMIEKNKKHSCILKP